MSVSFLVCLRDVAPRVHPTLSSVAAAARPGDEIVAVDCGSRDRTVAELDRFVGEHGGAEGVSVVPIALGTPGPGGAGVGLNVALDAARGDAVTALACPDLLHPAGFEAARSRWEKSGAELMVARHLGFDPGTGALFRPAIWPAIWPDRWPAAGRPGASGQTSAAAVLTSDAGIWSALVSRSLLRRNGLRFGAGVARLEDDPLLGTASLRATDGAWLDPAVVSLRAERRPGEGADASARLRADGLFEAWDALRGALRRGEGGLDVAAWVWLVRRIAAQMTLVGEEALVAWAAAAHSALRVCDDALWQGVMAHGALRDLPALPQIVLLREHGIAAFLAVRGQALILQRIGGLERQVADLSRRIGPMDRPGPGAPAPEPLDARLDRVGWEVRALLDQVEFDALCALQDTTETGQGAA